MTGEPDLDYFRRIWDEYTMTENIRINAKRERDRTPIFRFFKFYLVPPKNLWVHNSKIIESYYSSKKRIPVWSRNRLMKTGFLALCSVSCWANPCKTGTSIHALYLWYSEVKPSVSTLKCFYCYFLSLSFGKASMPSRPRDPLKAP